ncbi:hypothetical protein DDP54_06130 [Cellulomonas sp. WB94]|uniref:hypothetical protein n=1 Tax=Cellulomonas sp. WB94 TaxID=2173174 RepID=UPI000D584397|nr:hypothetical protein [Cellulomonas sp. WB94]PVU82653.1 hypothetical protein DDP54_06130 [Cellulomonas sp. WB94]
MPQRAVDEDGPVVPRASRVVVVLAWALAVLVAGAVTSWAVGVISNEQGPARDRVLAESQVTAELAAQRALTSATPAVTPAAPQSPAATPDAEPSALPTVTPSTAPAPSAPATPPPAPAPAEVARTWDVAGGQVGASCTGPVLRLLYATPLDGWTVEVKHAGSDELEVAFRQHDAETTVHAHCIDGVPTQDTDADEPTSGVR